MRAALALTTLLLTACASVAPPPDSAVLADRLFCGRMMPDGGSVSDEEWNAFVRDVVTPRFPLGFTIWSAHGQWRDNKTGETVREPVMIIEIVHPMTRENGVKIEEIADEYRRRFHQDAVLRVTLPARMEFIE